MKLLLDEQGHAVLENGNPVYEHSDGKRVAFDAPGTVATITRLNGEARSHREGKEAAETKLKAFEGITDPAAAIAALNVVSNLDQKKLIEAGKVDEIKAAAIAATEERFKPIVAERDTLQSQLYQEKIGGSFTRSKFVADKIAVPVHMLERTYGSNFKIEDGKVVAYDANGNRIYSRTKPGEAADFDEALEHIIAADPFRDSILKGNVGGGGGAGQSQGAPGQGGSKSMTRAEFDALPPKERSERMTTGGYTITG